MSFVSLRVRAIDLRYLLWVALGVTTGLVSSHQAFAQTNAFIVTELSGEDASQVPRKLNNLGDIVGRKNSAQDGSPRATIWNHSRLISKHLGALSGGDYSSGSDINDAGEIVGVSNTANAIVPFLWTAKGGLRRVPLLPGDICGEATAVNKYGHVAGYSSGPNGTRAFLWTRPAGMHDLRVLSGGNYSRACSLNDLDEVAGTSASSTGERAVVWTRTGTAIDLGTLPGDWASEAAAINNAGDVVGYSKGPGGMRAFLWTKDSGMQGIGVLPGGHSSQALGINDSGEIVGTSTSSSGERAFVWTKQTGMIDLNSASSADLGAVFIEAHAINSRGEILVMGRTTHEPGMTGDTAPGEPPICAPAPPSSFILTPVTAQ